MCRLCRMRFTLIGSCVASVDCDKLFWLTSSLIGSSFVSVDLDWPWFAHVSTLPNLVSSLMIGPGVDSDYGDRPWKARVSPLSTVIYPEWYFCNFRSINKFESKAKVFGVETMNYKPETFAWQVFLVPWLWLTPIGPCVDSVDCDRSWLVQVSNFWLWMNLNGSSFDFIECDWPCSAHMLTLSTEFDPVMLLCRLYPKKLIRSWINFAGCDWP